MSVRFTSDLLTPAKTTVAQAVLPLVSDEHVVALRRTVRERAVEIKLSLVDQTKLVTAASELARNTIKYGGGGEVQVLCLSDGVRHGVQLMFADDGPGIPDLALALTDGYTTGGGLGLGLSGAKRLVDEFAIDTRQGEGTVVSVVKWKR
ncbi:ATP-binding protein [Massilia sp. R2A-15]|uniref:ATP-binding protein n=1 Tax=Massilia sp. R2A-15 TaxID=3064278 RepID=UPI002732A41A|nr:ATP-binding protein [Massilia sp. R2A-15]WLI91191.1 ATP-binding protein [Massilia sp. R2A-15]